MASITDYARMCKAHNGRCVSNDCPMSYKKSGKECTCDELMRTHAAKASAIIDKWCAEHPQKTYKQDFLEKFPNAEVLKNGTPNSCKKCIYGGVCSGAEPKKCHACWNEVMSEETGND